ncbi:MAG: hypothetical protein KA163_07355, partial [Bacteroidia bacterium]|nr:hypothetical protein [Bacteroidia bacterium]
MKRLKLLIFLISFFGVFTKTFAGDETRNSRAYGPNLLLSGTYIEVSDDKFDGTSSWISGFTNIANKAVVEMGLNEDMHVMHTSYFKTKVTFDVELTDAFLNTTILTNQQLFIDYDPLEKTRYKDKAQIVYGNAYKVKVYNIQFQTCDQANICTNNIVSPDVYMQAEVTTNRIYNFSLGTTIIVPGQYNSVFKNASNENELEIYWAYILGAEEYELEYTYIDDYNLPGVSGYKNQANVEYDFEHDATRIVTPFNTFRIPLNYEHGYIVYRVRPIGKDALGKRIDGAWSAIPIKSNVDDLNTNYPSANAVFQLTSPLASDALNWISSKTFAEDGKTGTGINYIDGAGLTRQNLARLNTEEKSIAQSTIYDHYKRPRFSLLPAPVGDLNFSYRPNLNRIKIGSNSFVFDKTKFDACIGLCGTSNFPLDSLSSLGAANYYSPRNPNKKSQQGFIPDANGFPYVELKYKPDATGRISRQTMPGSTHTMGSGRDIQYFYANPTQVELDRLFGKEAGTEDKYTKNYMIDPNGQYSTSYIDMYGRVVATALLGDEPPGIDPLPNKASPITLTHNLGISPPNTVKPDDYCIEVNTSFFVPTTNSQQTFNYSTTLGKFIPSECAGNLCFDCLYELEISVKDECGNEVFWDHDNSSITPPIAYESSFGASGPPYVSDCSGIPTSTIISTLLPATTVIKTTGYNLPNTPLTIVFPKIGTYTIYKKICVSDKPIQDYLDIYKDSGCTDPFCSLVDSALKQTDFSLCPPTDCISCLHALQTYTDLAASTSTTNTKPQLTSEQIDELVGQCKKLCPGNSCDTYKKLMMQDFVPGGFFGQTTSTGPNWVISVYNTSNTLGTTSFPNDHDWNSPPVLPYLNNSGGNALVNFGSSSVPPQALPNVSLFISNFKESWAESFLPLHPEYCKLKFYCDVVGGALDYDQAMVKVNHYEEACTLGYLIPYNFSYTYGPSSPCINNQDPIFGYLTSTAYGSSVTAMTNSITVTSFTTGGINLYQYVTNQVYGGSSNVPTLHVFGGDPCTRDIEWIYFRDYYLAFKKALYQQMLDKYITMWNISTGQCSSTLPSGYQSHFPDDNDLVNINDPNDPNFTSNVNTFIATNIASQCSTTCASYRVLWQSDLATSCPGFNSLSTINQNKLLDDLEAICNLGCDPNHPNGSSSTPSTSGGYTIPGSSSVVAYNFQDILNYYLPSPTCGSYIFSMPLPYSQSDPSVNNKLTDCKCDQLLQVQYDFDNTPTSSLPSGVTTAWGLFKYRYGFDLGDFNSAICACKSFISPSTWAPGFTWSATQLQNVTNSNYTTDPKLACNSCLKCTDVVTQMNSLFSSLPNTSGYTNAFDAINQDIVNEKYAENALNIYFNANYTSQTYLDLYADCDQFNSTSTQNSFVNNITYEAQDLFIYLKDLLTTKKLLVSHPMAICTDIKYFTSQLYTGLLPVPSTFGQNYVTTLTGNNLQIDIKNSITSAVICSINLTLPSTFTGGWSAIKYFNYIQAYSPSPSPGPQYGFQINATDNSGNLLMINGTNTCYKISTLSASTPNVPMYCPQSKSLKNKCQIDLINNAFSRAEVKYKSYLDSLLTKFVSEYKEGCLGALQETFTRDYKFDEYQFTLYYYDEAGNLQRTVAPKGVDPLPITTNLSLLPSSTQQYPNHSSSTAVNTNYVNTYFFNTYNEPFNEGTVDGGLSNNYFYDLVGRIYASQNAKQNGASSSTNFIYSYTLYDVIGRIVEVGEIDNGLPLTPSITQDPFQWSSWMGGGPRRQVTRTFYDAPTTDPVVLAKFTSGQNNLRNRVAYITYEETDDGIATTFDHADYYSYDEHGNVTEMIQENTELKTLFAGGGLKKIVYEYELISGNMVKVTYQPNEADQFMHKYFYDADNRLHEVYTSRDDLNWDRDAKYFYYEHGPLARIERADKQVQGADYFYTIQGWIKGVNSEGLTINNDAGKDAAFTNAYNSTHTNLHGYFAKDAMGYSLNYYHNGTQKDYESINRSNYGITGNMRNPLSDYSLIASAAPFNIQTDGPDLFNGNISSMVTTFIDKDPIGNTHTNNTPYPQLTAYRYDQLHRIKQMKAYRDLCNNVWNPVTTGNYDDSYFTQLTYDQNGNIESHLRNGIGSTIKPGSFLQMDGLSYNYKTTANGAFVNSNQLYTLNDVSNPSNYSEDIDAPGSPILPYSPTGANRYNYDEVGNLIKDQGECIGNIIWTVDRKVKEVVRDPAELLAQGKTLPDIEYQYNGLRQRVVKIVKPRNSTNKQLMTFENWTYTYYNYDASGNVMATYDRASTPVPSSTTYKDALTLSEHDIYGSARLALAKPTDVVEWAYTFTPCFTFGGCRTIATGPTSPLASTAAGLHERKLGYKEFELNNHLGNVIAVVSDRKVQVGQCAAYQRVFDDGDLTGVYPDVAITSIENGMLKVIPQSIYAGVNFGIPTTPGEVYSISFDIDMANSNASDGMLATAYGLDDTGYGTEFVSVPITTSGHYELTYTAQPQSTATKLYFTTGANVPGSGVEPHYFYIDNFRAIPTTPSPTPPPGSSCEPDALIPVTCPPGGMALAYYFPDVLHHADYYAFGMQMP